MSGRAGPTALLWAAAIVAVLLGVFFALGDSEAPTVELPSSSTEEVDEEPRKAVTLEPDRWDHRRDHRRSASHDEPRRIVDVVQAPPPTASVGWVKVVLLETKRLDVLEVETPVLLQPAGDEDRRRFEREIDRSRPDLVLGPGQVPEYLVVQSSSGIAEFLDVPLGLEWVVSGHPERVRFEPGHDGVRRSFRGPVDAGQRVLIDLPLPIGRPWLRIHVRGDDGRLPDHNLFFIVQALSGGRFSVSQRVGEDGFATLVLPIGFHGRLAAVWVADGSAPDSPLRYLGDLGPMRAAETTTAYAVLRRPVLALSGRVYGLDAARGAGGPRPRLRIQRSSDGERWHRLHRDVRWVDDRSFEWLWDPRPDDRYRIVASTGELVAGPVVASAYGAVSLDLR